MQGLWYSFLAGLATALGAIIIILITQPGAKILSGLLGFAGGIMIGISLFDLLPEAAELGSVAAAVPGFLLGAGLMFALDRFVPHAHMSVESELEIECEYNVSAVNNDAMRTGLLIFFGIALHNLPEGLAIGAGLQVSPQMGLYMALSIGLHNIPEGMAVAGPLRSGGVSRVNVFLLTLLAGLMTPLGTAAGLLLFRASSALVAGGLAFAAGAMIYIVSDELIPQSHRLDSHTANAGLIVGLVLVFVLTSSF